MKKMLILVTVLLFLAIFLGCTTTATDPVQLYEELSAKAEKTQNLRLDYSMSMGAGIIANNFTMDIEVAKFNDNTKTIIQMPLIFGTQMTVVSFSKENKTVTCTESVLSSGKIECTMGVNTYSQLLSPKPNLFDKNKFNITIAGDKTFGSRSCTDFIIIVLPQYFQDVYGSNTTGNSINPNGTATLESCLDKEYGVPIYFGLSFNSTSKLTGRTEKSDILSLVLKSLATDVKESEMAIPVPLTLTNVDCFTNNITINYTALVDKQSLPVSVNITKYGEPTELVNIQLSNLKFGKNMLTVVPVSTALTSGSYEVEVCSEDQCSSSWCYISENQVPTAPVAPRSGNTFSLDCSVSAAETQGLGKCWNWLSSHTYNLGADYTINRISGEICLGPYESHTNGTATIQTSYLGSYFSYVTTVEVSSCGVGRTTIDVQPSYAAGNYLRIYSADRYIDFSNLTVDVVQD